MLNSTGDVVVTYEYDTWGVVTDVFDGAGYLNYSLTVGEDNPFRYRGYYYDETSLYYLNQRYYNPEWGRFINADDLLGVTGGLLSHNVFAYCANNPVMFEDPDGDFFNLIAAAVGTVIGAAVGYVSNGISNIAAGRDFNDNWLSATVGGAVGGLVAGLTAGMSLMATAAISSAAGSLTEEVVSYAAGEQELTWENVGYSAMNFAIDTAIGTASAGIGGKAAQAAIPKSGPFCRVFSLKNFTRSNIGTNAIVMTKRLAYGSIPGGLTNMGLSALAANELAEHGLY